MRAARAARLFSSFRNQNLTLWRCRRCESPQLQTEYYCFSVFVIVTQRKENVIGRKCDCLSQNEREGLQEIFM